MLGFCMLILNMVSNKLMFNLNIFRPNYWIWFLERLVAIVLSHKIGIDLYLRVIYQLDSYPKDLRTSACKFFQAELGIWLAR